MKSQGPGLDNRLETRIHLRNCLITWKSMEQKYVLQKIFCLKPLTIILFLKPG